MNLKSIFFGAGRTSQPASFGLAKSGQSSATTATNGAAEGAVTGTTPGGADVAQMSSLARDVAQVRRAVDQAPVPASGRLASLTAAVQRGQYVPDVGLLTRRLLPVLAVS
jgi:ribosomal protein S11